MSKHLPGARDADASEPAPSTGGAGNAGTRRVDSAYLFSGTSTLIIEHRGACYTLRITRQDKLILTK